MANIKNFGLIGVGSSIQFGKAGPSLGQQAINILKADGTAAFRLPAGTTVQRPDPASAGGGGMRYNSTSGGMEYTDGSTWITLATGGVAVTEVSVASANGFSGSSSGGTTPQLTLGTTVSGLLKGDGTAISAAVSGTDIKTVGGTSLIGAGDVPVVTSIDFGTTGLTPATSSDGDVVVAGTLVSANGGTGLSTFSSGSVLYASGANTWAAAGPGATSGVQAWDADLDAIAALNSTGFAVRTAPNTWAERSITGSAGRIVITNGDGVASSPTIDLDTLSDGSTGTFLKFTRDTYGRVSGTTAVVQGDITGLVDSVYVNTSGDTMTGNLAMGSNYVTMDSAPVSDTQAANKAYVDAVAAGLSWKTAVKAATTTNVDISTDLENGDTLDGVTLTTGDRVLVKNQSAGADNGIYIVQATGAASRASDADTAIELDSATVFVQQGTVNADTGWTQTATIVTVGVTAQVWVQFSGSNTYTWGTGLGNTGNTVFVKLGAGISELPTDEVGIELFDTGTGALWLTTDGTTKSTETGAGLYLKLADSGGLTQDSTGLYISVSGVTNDMLANSAFFLYADSGWSEVSLGGTLNVIGTSGQGVSTSTTGSDIQITVQDATTALKGVASFDSSNFSVTAGAVSIAAGGIDLTTDVTGILPVANGGTGVNTLLDTSIVIGNGTAGVETTVALTFDSATNLLTIGGATIEADSGDLILTALNTNANIVLEPNGTGSVIVGPSGNDGVIESETGFSINMIGDVNVTVEALTGQIIFTLPTGTTEKLSITGPTATDYATGLAANDVPNVQYVTDAIAAATTPGAVLTFRTSVNLSTTGTTPVGTLPTGTIILSVRVQVVTADTASGTLEVGNAATPGRYMTTTENDTQTVGVYIAETYQTDGGDLNIIATVGGTPGGAGSANVIVEYALS
jgi:hypothetical protein